MQRLLEHGVALVQREPLLAHVHAALWVDLSHALRQHLGLGATDRAPQSVRLPVGVGDADLVGVHERERAHARACERLHGPRSHAAQPNHADMRACEVCKRAWTVQPTDALEAQRVVIGVVLEGGEGCRRPPWQSAVRVECDEVHGV